MKWVLTFALVSILTVACSGAAPTYTPVPTVNVAATVESAIEATRSVEREVRATEDALAEATRAAELTATPVVTTVFVPTPEPYVAGARACPGSGSQCTRW